MVLWWRWCKAVCVLAVVGLCAFVLLLFAADGYISYQTRARVFENMADVPARPVAVVLGTSNYIGKKRNPFYHYRIDAVSALYHSGLVNGVIVSGDNRSKYYNEPQAMANDLKRAGIPSQYITKDYAGFRTLDSVIRAKEVFGQQELILVSQRFHCQRALYIAMASGIDAVCYPAKDVVGAAGWKIRAREMFARLLALIDVHVLSREPHFLGPPETVPLRADVASGAVAVP